MAIAQLLVVRIASLMLRRELILQIRIPHVFVNVVALSTQNSFHSSSGPAIDNSKHLPFSVPTHTHVLGATPIKAPFDHCIIFFILIRSASPALELFFRGVVYIRNYTVISKCEMQKVVQWKLVHAKIQCYIVWHGLLTSTVSTGRCAKYVEIGLQALVHSLYDSC